MNFLISVVILTKNEESNIQRCISSLEWCNEVVVVDSGSKDTTVQLATKLGAKVFVNIPIGLFSAAKQRNWALHNCDLKGDWVLFVDADEVIPASLVNEIRETCSHTTFNAFQLTPRYLFWGKWLKRSLGYPNWHDRLLKRGEVFYEDESGSMECFTKDTKTSRLYEPYDHYANSKGFSDWLERHDRYSSWEAKWAFDFLETNNLEAFGTKGKNRLRVIAAKFWLLRPPARFIYMYFIRLGFLEGWESFIYCLLHAMYEFMTIIKIIELKRKKAGLSI
ncbi:glycosyltransferase family 2 protein [Calothrix rhizosoleniae]|uniref:glycosyltransferase family 2 protein n=1 Tax=Calothrix rhizosoleniae TaxID=888997 RepID=UPI000B4A306D|nr:glycosyltransferase family 2 protein [Calothrix rhizosoleniae]